MSLKTQNRKRRRLETQRIQENRARGLFDVVRSRSKEVPKALVPPYILTVENSSAFFTFPLLPPKDIFSTRKKTYPSNKKRLNISITRDSSSEIYHTFQDWMKLAEEKQ